MQQEFTTLQDITRKKAHVRAQADEQKKAIRGMWSDLTRHQESEPMTRFQKVLAVAGKASYVFDGVILGWKLYSKIKTNKRKRR